MYCWAGRDEYGEAALYNASFSAPQSEQPDDRYVSAAQANLTLHLIPYIEAHPDTQFDIFFPPYSAAEWATMKSKGSLEAVLTVRGLCYDALSAYPNVTLYDFAAREDWVLHLENYKDTLHYGQWINDAITACIADGESVVSSRETLDEATAQLRSWANMQIDAGGWIF